MPIDTAEVKRIAGLARLDLDGEAVERLGNQLQACLDYVSMLEELDVEAIPPTSQPVPQEPHLRDDEPRPSVTRQEALSNAPDPAAGHFGVPRVLPG